MLNKLFVKLIFILLTTSFITSSCTKDIQTDNAEENLISKLGIKFKIDGKDIEYNQNTDLTFNVLMNNGKYGCGGGASLDTKNDKNNLTILIEHDRPLVLNKKYVNFLPSLSSDEFINFLLIIYSDSSGETFTSWGEAVSAIHNVKSSGYIIPTEINASYVKGIFGGKVYNEDFTEFKQITEGSFWLKRY